jgi:DNA-binding XRE family transcriptional regulator
MPRHEIRSFGDPGEIKNMATPIIITACQVRAARAMLTWSKQKLAQEAGLGEATIGRMEKGFGILKIQDETRDKLLACFDREGLTLKPEIGDKAGPGVMYGAYPGRIVA